MSTSYDVIIVGGGVVGATLALALAQQTSLSIAVLDAAPSAPSWSAASYHHRVSAVTRASQQIFQSLGVWDAMTALRAHRFCRIEVWNENEAQTLAFDSNEVSELYLGHIIENTVLQSVLYQSLQQTSNVAWIAPITLNQFNSNAEKVMFTDSDGKQYQGKLAVAADGANSWLRTAANIAHETHDYGQSAIVTTVTTEQAHDDTARQRFIATGPLAFLPLASSHLSSIVWSLPTDQAEQLMQLEQAAFNEQLAHAFNHCLGKVMASERRFCFPLKRQAATDYIAERVALVGDAAHVVHPLAGQGVNIGLLDAAALAELITLAVKSNRSIASTKLLRQYQRWRRADNAALLQGIDVIKTVFSSNQQIASLLLTTVNRLPLLKNYFTRHAIGKRADLPKLAQLLTC